jgi:hemoglobin
VIGAMESRSLYERIGGEAAILAAVDLFYERVLADPLTQPFFAGLDMSAQARKQTAFMAWALGGPTVYRGRDLRAAHAPLVRKGLNQQHFDAIAGHLRATLEEMGVEPALVAEALATVAGTRDQVLGG